MSRLKSGGSTGQGRDFVSFLLYSSAIHEPEYEIRLKASDTALKEYQEMLRQKKVLFRRVGLDIFPPPVIILTDQSIIADAIAVLIPWYAKYKDRGRIEISVLMPDGSVVALNGEEDIQGFLDQIK